jgi:hypothetical protein
MADAEEATAKKPAVVKLKHPVTVGDKTISEVALDLESLTGADIEMAVREAGAATGQLVVAFEIDTEFHAQIAAKLSGVGREVFRKMHAQDYQKVMAPIRAFFLDSE